MMYSKTIWVISSRSVLSPRLGGGVVCLKRIKALQACVQWRYLFFSMNLLRILEDTSSSPFKNILSVFS